MKIRTLVEGKEPAIYCIHPDESIFNCIKILNAKHFGALLVLSQEKGTILGIISERDILRITHERRGQLEGIKVKEVMTPRMYMVFSSLEDNIHNVLEQMNAKKVRHMPIVDYSQDELLVGFLAIGDIIRALLECAESKLNNS